MSQSMDRGDWDARWEKAKADIESERIALGLREEREAIKALIGWGEFHGIQRVMIDEVETISKKKWGEQNDLQGWVRMFSDDYDGGSISKQWRIHWELRDGGSGVRHQDQWEKGSSAIDKMCAWAIKWIETAPGNLGAIARDRCMDLGESQRAELVGVLMGEAGLAFWEACELREQTKGRESKTGGAPGEGSRAGAMRL